MPILVKDMKKLLSLYNKSVRKGTYKNIWKMKKDDLIALINKDFSVRNTKAGRKQYKHKSGRFTKII